MSELIPGLPAELSLRAARDSSPSCEVRGGPAAWTLHLWGALPGGWCGNLAVHCFGARISIERGEARLLRAGRWAGCFRLRPLCEGIRPESFDFVRMALRRPVLTLDPGVLPLRRLHVLPPRAEGLPARLFLEADDELGLLARVLCCCDAAGLQPTRLSLLTRSRVALDRFWLHAADGGSPRADELERLRSLLAKLEARR